MTIHRPLRFGDIQRVIQKCDAKEVGEVMGTYEEAYYLLERLQLTSNSLPIMACLRGSWESVTTSFYERLYKEERLWGGLVVDNPGQNLQCGALAFFCSDKLLQLIEDHPWFLLNLPRFSSLSDQILSFSQINQAWLTGTRELNMVIGHSFFPKRQAPDVADRAMSLFKQSFLESCKVFPLRTYTVRSYGDYQVQASRTAFSYRGESGATKVHRFEQASLRTELWRSAFAEGVTSSAGDSLSYHRELYLLFQQQSMDLPAQIRATIFLASLEELDHEKIGRILAVKPDVVRKRLERVCDAMGNCSVTELKKKFETRSHNLALLPQWLFSLDFACELDSSSVRGRSRL